MTVYFFRNYFRSEYEIILKYRKTGLMNNFSNMRRYDFAISMTTKIARNSN